MNNAGVRLVSASMNTSIRSLLFLLVGLAGAASLSAQRRPAEATVTLFSGPNFTGERITLSADEKIDDFNFTRFPSGRGANNRVSSIRVEGDLEVTLYLYREFSGEKITFRDSVARLSRLALHSEPETWDDNLSSITVRSLPSRTHRPTPANPHFIGPVVSAPQTTHRPSAGYNRRDRHNETFKIVRQAYLDVLDREADPQGLVQYAGIVEDRGWSEDRLRQELRRSREYRNVTIPRRIARAYQEVLGREPDSAGKSFYTRQMLSRGWTETRVRDALKQSPEYAQRKVMQRNPSRGGPVLAGQSRRLYGTGG